MARRRRVEYAEAIYHVIQRGNNKEYVFDNYEDKAYLVGCLQRVVDVDGVEIFSYVVMSNHYHIAMRSGREIGIHIGLTDSAVSKWGSGH